MERRVRTSADHLRDSTGLTSEEVEAFKKLVLFHPPEDVALLSCEAILESRFPGFTHKIGIVESMPPLERYLRCSEFLIEVTKANDAEEHEIPV